MDHLGVFFLSFFFLYFQIEAQIIQPRPPTKYVSAHESRVHQSITILIVIISFLLFITFFLIIYPRLRLINRRRNDLISTLSSIRVSGINKSVINSLPSFTFSSLQGSKEGLECAVCLSNFKDTEVLRLLPKCKHAFHGSCVDKWLERNSNCPLCRQKVNIEDISKFKLSPSFGIPHRSPSDAVLGIPMATCTSEQEPHELGLTYSNNSNTDVEFFVQREENDDKEDTSTEKEINKTCMHKFKHKIMVLGVVFSGRWSDVDSSDIISLNSDMMNSTSSRTLCSYSSHSERYISTMLDNTTTGTDDQKMKFKEEMEERRLFDRSCSVSDSSIPSTSDTKPKSDKSLNAVITSWKRSVSEITTLSRFSDFSGGNVVGEEKRRAWLAIAKQTVQWFGSEERSKQSQFFGKQPMV